MKHDAALRTHLIALLDGGQAYETMATILKSIPHKDHHRIPKGAEHSAWQILDHMVFTLNDIIEFSDNADGKYREKSWPDDYWSKGKGDWDKSLRAYRRARKRLEALVLDSKRDLFKPFPWGDGQTLLREALLAADHQSYHLGELVQLQRWLNKG